jgi:hypothetical protein
MSGAVALAGAAGGFCGGTGRAAGRHCASAGSRAHNAGALRARAPAALFCRRARPKAKSGPLGGSGYTK